MVQPLFCFPNSTVCKIPQRPHPTPDRNLTPLFYPKSAIRFSLSFVLVSSRLQRSCFAIAGYGEMQTAAR